MVIAHEWNLTPTEFWDRELEEQAIMIAFIETRNSMDVKDTEVTPMPQIPPSMAGIKR